MLTATVDTLTEIVGGELLSGSGETVVNGAAVDCRAVSLGALYFELSTGSEAAADTLTALSAGSRAVMVARPLANELADAAHAKGAAVIRVPDVRSALSALAAYQRGRLHCPVVAVTGPSGKTTTRDVISAVLSTKLRVSLNDRSDRDGLALPMAVLEAGQDTDVLVLEMPTPDAEGAEQLYAIARPTIGMVVNIGQTHSMPHVAEQDARHEATLASVLPKSGRLFLNGDDLHSYEIAEAAEVPITLYGLDERCDVKANDIELDAQSMPTFTLVAPDIRVPVTLRIPGRHNVYNALAAAALGLHLRLTPEDVVAGLERTIGSGAAMQVFSAASGVTVVNGAYEATPTSMRHAVDALASMQAAGRRVAVLGDMAELDSLAELAHFRIGEHVAHASLDRLVTVGERAARIADGARAAGMDPAAVNAVGTIDQVRALLATELASGDVVLVKASRVVGLERVVEGLVNVS